MKKLNEYLESKRNNIRAGVDANRNGSAGKYGVDEPVDDDVIDDDFIDKRSMDKGMKMLNAKFKAEEDFLILGRPGWGKTSVINKLAKQFKREVITVYLDKCEPSDLGGIPAAGEDSAAYLPAWAAYMYNHPDKNFLLFFDEIDQAKPSVLDAIMPIVLEHEVCNVKFDNFFVGAAANYADENAVSSEISKPLESRFKPIIKWECNWDAAFKYLHKIWDEKLGKEFVSKVESCRNIFVNPRDIDRKIFKFIFKLKNAGDYDEIVDTDFFYDRLISIAKENISKNEQNQLKKLADFEVELFK